MKRQLYYLLPDFAHTQDLYADLKHIGVPDKNIHIEMKYNSRLEQNHDANKIVSNDRDYYLEWYLWRLNLAVFGIAFLALVGLIIWQPSYYVIIPIAVMIATFTVGLYFAQKVPNVHWNEFVSALRHGEVLLIVDTTIARVYQIDHVIRQQHPEAINGGVCWKT